MDKMKYWEGDEDGGGDGMNNSSVDYSQTEVVFLVSLGLPAAMGDIIMILTQLITRFEEARWQSQFCLCFLRGCIINILAEPL